MCATADLQGWKFVLAALKYDFRTAAVEKFN
jgi:hypothetical protein